MPHDPHLLTTDALGLESRTVRLAPYDARWPELFAAEKARLERAVSPLTIALEHTGSTAVPGLAAKPILDILAGYPSGTSPEPYIERFVAAGYVHRGEQGIPGREFFRFGDPRAYHVHLTAIGSEFWSQHLAFRDYLRSHGDARDEYARVKRELAARFPRDREAYIEGKGPFVRRILELAATATPPKPFIPTELRTPRLLLRPWRAEDAPALLPVLEANIEHLGPWIPARVANPAPLPLLAQRLMGFGDEFAANREWRYAMLSPDGADVFGEIDLFPRSESGRVPFAESDRAELGYWLRSDATGQGLVTEAARVVLGVAATIERFAFVEIRCDARNEKSAAIPRRLGFVLDPRAIPDSNDEHLQVWVSPPAALSRPAPG